MRGAHPTMPLLLLRRANCDTMIQHPNSLDWDAPGHAFRRSLATRVEDAVEPAPRNQDCTLRLGGYECIELKSLGDNYQSSLGYPGLGVVDVGFERKAQ